MFCFVLFVCLFVCLFVFWDRVSLDSPGCSGTHFVDQAGIELRNPPASASQVLGLKATVRGCPREYHSSPHQSLQLPTSHGGRRGKNCRKDWACLQCHQSQTHVINNKNLPITLLDDMIKAKIRIMCTSQAWWHMPLIPALRRQRQADFWVQGQPGLQSEFQNSQGYAEKYCL